MQTQVDATALKQREHSTWTAVAPGWRKHDERLTQITKPVTERLLDLAGVGLGHHVLDIACGTGEPAIPAALRVRDGHVVATDFVEEMLAFAREKAAAKGVRNVEFRRADGEGLSFPDASFDAVTVRFGLMFMPTPLACLTKAHQVLRPGGRIAVACWAGPEENLWASLPMRVIRRELEMPAPPPSSPGLFAFADRSRLESVLKEAGFRNVVAEPVKVRMSDFDSGAEYFTWTRELAGPVATLFAQLPPQKQTAVKSEIEKSAAGADGRVVYDGVTWVACGVK